MRIELNKLPSDGMTILLSGKESWLGDIYRNFEELPEVKQKPNEHLQANLQIVKRPIYNDSQLSGNIHYRPYLSCSRCDEPIQLDLSSDLNVTIRPFLGSNPNESGEFELTREDLETYFVEEDGVLDLFVILNDIIQLNVPSQIVPESSPVVGTHHCAQRVLEKIAKENADERLSPFGVLATLKDRLPD